MYSDEAKYVRLRNLLGHDIAAELKKARYLDPRSDFHRPEYCGSEQKELAAPFLSKEEIATFIAGNLSSGLYKRSMNGWRGLGISSQNWMCLSGIVWFIIKRPMIV